MDIIFQKTEGNNMKLLLSLLAMSSIMWAASTKESVTLGGTKTALTGTAINVGDNAPKVTLLNGELKSFSVGGKSKNTQLLVVVPSIDTPICDFEARTFNEEAAGHTDVDIYVISMDLPFASKRYCAAHGIDRINVLSDFQTKAFGKAYGMLINEGPLKGILARAIYIVKDGKVTYKQLVPEIKQKPDFKAVLKAL